MSPHVQDEQPGYYDKLAADYDGLYQDPVSMAENSIVADMTRELVADKEIRRVLDIGCGTGLIYELAPFDLGKLASYTGIDISQGMLDKFREKVDPAVAHRVNLIRADVNTLALDVIHGSGETTDLAVSSFGSFSYVEDPEQMIRSLIKNLTPNNGHLLAMVYSQYSARNLMLREKTKNPEYTAARRSYAFRNDTVDESSCPPANFYTEKRLRDIAESAGLRNVQVRGLNSFFGLNEANNGIPMATAKKELVAEMYQSPYADLGHSLIVTGTNYDRRT